MDKALLISYFAIAAVLVLMFFLIEKKKLPLSTFLPVVVMVAIGSIGRIIFGFIPNVQPVTVIVIIMGLCYSPESGFLTGALSALVSNMVMGQGPWTLWQMFAWGMIGLLAGFLGKLKPCRTLYFAVPFAAVSAFLFSMITDCWTVMTLGDGMTLGSAMAVFGAGLLFNIPHAIFNAALCALIFLPMRKRLQRIKTKYV
ncbi:MAG: ECF transporter S component [Clostridia bacterium]|nr:ECF transporter S component [Clostridia bacterium]